MNLQMLLLFLNVCFALVEGDKLSKEENENRLEICGKKIQSKIFHGAYVNPSDSPWSVHVRTKLPPAIAGGDSPSSLCSGTIISSRHVLTATHCVAGTTPNMDGFVQIAMSGKKIEKKDCTGQDYIIEDPAVAAKVEVFRGSQVFENNKQGFISRAKKLWLISACRKFDSGDVLSDLTLIELEKDLDPMNLRMACVSDSMAHVAAGAVMDFYGYGTEPNETHIHTNGSRYNFQYQQTQIIEPRFVYRSPTPKSGKGSVEQQILARPFSEDSVACEGDSGGGATRVIKGRTTVVGVASQTTCKMGSRTIGSLEYYVPVASKSEKFCEFGGICSASFNSNHLLIVFLFLCSFLLE